MADVEVHIDTDEWYPVYTVSPYPDMGDLVTVPEETVARWKEATAAFQRVQEEILALLDAKGPERPVVEMHVGPVETAPPGLVFDPDATFA